MNDEIDQIIATAIASNMQQEEAEECRKFLQHIQDVAIPDEREGEEPAGLPTDKPSPLQALFNEAKTNAFFLDLLLGEYWETMFCDQISLLTEDCYTRLLQRYKVFGTAHASRNVGLVGKKRQDISLPDVEIYQSGKGLIAHADVKHKLPLRNWSRIGLDIDVYEIRVRLFGDSPCYFVIHNYLHYWDFPFNKKIYDAVDKEKKEKWNWHNKLEDWKAMQIAPSTPVSYRDDSFVYFDLELFVGLSKILKDLQKE